MRCLGTIRDVAELTSNFIVYLMFEVDAESSYPSTQVKGQHHLGDITRVKSIDGLSEKAGRPLVAMDRIR